MKLFGYTVLERTPPEAPSVKTLPPEEAAKYIILLAALVTLADNGHTGDVIAALIGIIAKGQHTATEIRDLLYDVLEPVIKDVMNKKILESMPTGSALPN